MVTAHTRPLLGSCWVALALPRAGGAHGRFEHRSSLRVGGQGCSSIFFRVVRADGQERLTQGTAGTPRWGRACLDSGPAPKLEATTGVAGARSNRANCRYAVVVPGRRRWWHRRGFQRAGPVLPEARRDDAGANGP